MPRQKSRFAKVMITANGPAFMRPFSKWKMLVAMMVIRSVPAQTARRAEAIPKTVRVNIIGIMVQRICNRGWNALTQG